MLEEHTKLEGQLADGAKVKKDMEAQMNAIKDEHNKTYVFFLSVFGLPFYLLYKRTHS